MISFALGVVVGWLVFKRPDLVTEGIEKAKAYFAKNSE